MSGPPESMSVEAGADVLRWHFKRWSVRNDSPVAIAREIIEAAAPFFPALDLTDAELTILTMDETDCEKERPCQSCDTLRAQAREKLRAELSRRVDARPSDPRSRDVAVSGEGGGAR